MTDQAQAAPVTDTAAAAAAAAAATATPPAPAGDNTGAAPAPARDTSNGAPAGTDLNGSDQDGDSNDWTTVLDDDTRQLVEQKGYKSPNDLGKAYRELSKKLGERPTLEAPADDAAPEEWQAYYEKLGRPKAPEEYAFKLPEGVPENIPYDNDFAVKFKNWAHDAGLSPRQAQALHDKYVQDFTGQLEGSIAQHQQRVEEAHSTLVKEWGDPETEGYRQNVEMARRALVQLDLRDDLTSAGLMDENGMVLSAKVAKALSRVGQRMFAEDSMFGGQSAGITNPFSDKSENMTQQSMLIKSDPARATQMIRAAGKNPADYGL